MIRKIFLFLVFANICLAVVYLFYPHLLGPFLPGRASLEEPAEMMREKISFDFNSRADIEAWRKHSFKGETQYEVTEEEGVKYLKAFSHAASSAIFKPVKVNIGNRPVLSWEWRTLHFPQGKKNEKFAAREDNDFSGRIYAIFKGGGMMPLQQQEIIQYVWDDHFPEGETGESPFMKSVKVLVIQSGPAQGWVAERRDLAADYKQLFGKEPENPLMGIGLMSDSDNTQSSSEAHFRYLQIEAEPGAAAEVSAEEASWIEGFALDTKRFFDSVKHNTENLVKTSSQMVAKSGKKVVELAKKVEVEE